MRPLVVFLGVGVFLVGAAGTASASDESKFKARCPAGTEAFGKPPPAGKQIWCRQPVPGGFIRQGNYTAFNRNGSKRVDGMFVNNMKNGRWTTYDRFGRKVKETVFQNDKAVGETRYDSKGKPIASGNRMSARTKKKQRDNLTDWSGTTTGYRSGSR